MTEKEKMLAGESYDCGDKELITRWHLAKKLAKQYYDRGENVWVSAPIHVDYGENIHLGNNIEINMN